MKRLKIYLSAILTIILVIGLVEFVAFANEGDPEKLVFANVPAGTLEDTIEKFCPLLDWVSEQIGIPIEHIVATDYGAVMTAIEYGHADMVRLGAGTVGIGYQNFGLKPLVREVKSNTHESFYYSVIVVPTDGKIQCVCDLCRLAPELSIAFVDPGSASGYTFPLYMIQELGLTLGDFKGVFYAGNHEAAIVAMKHGQADMACTNLYRIQKALDGGVFVEGEYQILLTSEPIPNIPISVHPSMDIGLQERITAAWLSIPPEICAVFGLDGFIETDVDPYLYILKVQEEIGL